MQTQVEELPENRVRLEIEVPSAEVKHAIDHAASDLATSLRIPGFRKGKIPMPVLLARVGRERLYAEAVESHIGGWFSNAAARSRIRPVAQPEYGYELPSSERDSFRFTATVVVQPKPEVVDWTGLEVPAGEADVPEELVERELRAVQESVAELTPVDDRPALEGDTLVADLVNASGEAQRDVVVELGNGTLIEEIERGLVGMKPHQPARIDYAGPDGSQHSLEATVKEIKEKVLPSLDDDLARAATEFQTLEELRSDIEERLRKQLEDEIESAFRAAAVDRLAEASQVDPSGPLVDSRTAELLRGFLLSLERRGIAPETYLQLTGDTPAELQERLRDEARRAVARELVLEAAADKLGIEVSDEELRAFIREQAEPEEEDVERVVEEIWANPRREQLREDLRLRAALDRVASEVKRIPLELAHAREKLWTPGKEKSPGDTKLWTPGTKEPA
ncbi:MAG: trigger factor [Actinobacteria bacterium]|nr:trigger factor [Actinomycetota bacterium]